MNQNFYNSNSLGFDQTQPLQFPVIHKPPQEASNEMLYDQENTINFVQTFLRKFNRYSFFETPKVLLLAWDRVFKMKDAPENKQYKPDDTQELFRELFNDVQNIHEELAKYINTPSWNRPAFYDDDDDDMDYTIAMTPILSTEEPDNSLSMGDEHLDTISATESDEVLKSSVENLIPIPSEFEGIPQHMCDVPFHDNSPPLDASPLDSELVSSEVMEIVIPEVGGIDDDILLTITYDILREKLLNVNLLIAKIKALNDNPTLSSDCKTKSPSTSLNSLLKETNTSDNSLLGNGSPTTYSDSSLYASFLFDLSINPFPLTDRSDFYEFIDELIPFISPPEYDCFLFKVEPNSRDFTKDMVDDISLTKEPQVHFALPTHPNLQLNMKFQPSSKYLFTYVVWIFLPFLVYSVAPYYLLSLRNEDTIFGPGICNSHFSRTDISHRIDDDILLTIKDDILREKLLNVNLLIAKIEALNDNPTPSFDCKTKSPSTSLNSLLEETNTSDNSLPEFENFCFDVEEISSGSTTTHSDNSLPEYEVFHDDYVKEINSGSPTTHSYSSLYASFLFDLSINHFLLPIGVEPNLRDFTKDVVEDISPTKEPQVHNALPTHPNLQLNMKFQPSSEYIFTYVVWIFLPFLVYSVAPHYLLSLRIEDTIFYPGICNSHFSRPDISHRCGTFPRFKVLLESPMEIFSSTCSPMDN
nr:hypothetical protein [Tanacetum cinerariifolium]